jgi:DNA-binding protein YbaB
MVERRAGGGGLFGGAHLAFLRQQRQELRALRTRQIESAATSPDGLITATVDGRGRLLDLWLDERIYRTQDSRAFARVVIDTIRTAAEASQR